MMQLGGQQQRLATQVLSAVSREAAMSGPAAASVLVEVVAQQRQGIQTLLSSMACSSDSILSHAAASVVVGLAATAQLHPGPEAAAITEAWFEAVIGIQEPAGMAVLLQSLHVPVIADAAALAVMTFAVAVPGRLLQALLTPQHRRGLQSLLRGLDSSRRVVALLSSAALERMLGAADEAQLGALLQHLLRCVQQQSSEAAR
jgi:hypothetical protein